MFCSSRSELVNHLFFPYSLAKYCWNILNFTFDINMYPVTYDGL